MHLSLSNGTTYRRFRSLMHCQQIYVICNTYGYCDYNRGYYVLAAKRDSTMWIDLHPEEQNERYTMLHISIHVATYYVIHRPGGYMETLNFMEMCRIRYDVPQFIF